MNLTFPVGPQQQFWEFLCTVDETPVVIQQMMSSVKSAPPVSKEKYLV